MASYSIYSLADVKAVVSHEGVGRMALTADQNGSGRIGYSSSGDLSSHSTSANGYVTINKLKAHGGTLTMEIPANSNSFVFLKKLIAYMNTSKTDQFGLCVVTIDDTAAKTRYTFVGVTPQKEPDGNWDSTAGTPTFTWLYADKIESKM